MKMVDVDDEKIENIPEVKQPKIKKQPEISAEELIKKTIEISSSVRNMEPESDVNYFYIEGIPTNYRLYPEGTRIIGRPLKVLEIKKLATINEGNADYIINDILKRTIKGIDIENIYEQDKLFIIFWLRSMSYRDSGFVVDFKCPKCQKDSSYHFEIANLEVKTLSDSYDVNKILTLPSGNKISLKFLTVADEMKLDRFKEINDKTIGQMDDGLLRLAAMVQTIDGQEKSISEKYMFIIDMSPSDFSYINAYIEKFGMGIQPYMNIDCVGCGGRSQQGITFQPDFFVPTYKFE